MLEDPQEFKEPLECLLCNLTSNNNNNSNNLDNTTTVKPPECNNNKDLITTKTNKTEDLIKITKINKTEDLNKTNNLKVNNNNKENLNNLNQLVNKVLNTDPNLFNPKLLPDPYPYLNNNKLPL